MRASGAGIELMPDDDEEFQSAGDAASDSPAAIRGLRLATLESLDDGVWISETDGTVLYRNAPAAGMERMYWSHGGHVGTLEDVVFSPAVLQLLRERGRWSAEYHLSSGDESGTRLSSVAMEMQLVHESGVGGIAFHARDVEGAVPVRGD